MNIIDRYLFFWKHKQMDEYYLHKEKVYRMIRNDVFIKNSLTGAWESGIQYVNSKGTVFVRETTEFYDEFRHLYRPEDTPHIQRFKIEQEFYSNK